MTDWKIHPEAPTDRDENPVHPDNPNRHICGRGKSEKTTRHHTAGREMTFPTAC